MYKNRKVQKTEQEMTQRTQKDKEGRFLDYMDGDLETNRKMSYNLLLSTMKVLWRY